MTGTSDVLVYSNGRKMNEGINLFYSIQRIYVQKCNFFTIL